MAGHSIPPRPPARTTAASPADTMLDSSPSIPRPCVSPPHQRKAGAKDNVSRDRSRESSMSVAALICGSAAVASPSISAEAPSRAKKGPVRHEKSAAEKPNHVRPCPGRAVAETERAVQQCARGIGEGRGETVRALEERLDPGRDGVCKGRLAARAGSQGRLGKGSPRDGNTETGQGGLSSSPAASPLQVDPQLLLHLDEAPAGRKRANDHSVENLRVPDAARAGLEEKG